MVALFILSIDNAQYRIKLTTISFEACKMIADEQLDTNALCHRLRLLNFLDHETHDPDFRGLIKKQSEVLIAKADRVIERRRQRAELAEVIKQLTKKD